MSVKGVGYELSRALSKRTCRFIEVVTKLLEL